MKTRVCILCGGRSAEHEISLISAMNVFNAIDKDKFEAEVMAIDKDGIWRTLQNGSADIILDTGDPKAVHINMDSEEVALVPGRGAFVSRNGTEKKFDVVLPILHGPNGEDGTAQGMLRCMKTPFAGSDVAGSAVCMDKELTKRILRDEGIPTAGFMVVHDIKDMPLFDIVRERIGHSFFIKPCNMGSSVGVNKVTNAAYYMSSAREAFKYDSKIIIEETIEGQEIECAVLGNDEPVASMPGEIKTSYNFYSYEAKYLNEKGTALYIPGRIDDKVTLELQKLAVRTYKLLCCSGLARIDFFVCDGPGGVGKKIYVNEVNTIPGFTNISMYPKLFEATGIPYSELITRIIELALEKAEKAKSRIIEEETERPE